MSDNTVIGFATLEQVLNDYGRQIVESYRNILDAEGINATDALKNTLSWHVSKEGDTYVLYLTIQDYWKWLERGTRLQGIYHQQGKKPPFSPLLKWVQNKPVAPWNDKLKKMPLNKAQKAMAAMLRQSIWKKGTKPLHILERSMPSKEQVTETLKAAIRLDLEHWVKDIQIAFRRD